MKPLEELIKIYEKGISEVEAFDVIDDALYYLRDLANLQKDYNILYDKYWREYNHQQENSSLTWDELKTMIGKPFWLEKEYNFDMLNEKSKIGQWVVIESAPKNIHDNYYIFLTNNDVLDKNDMNKRWRAYRKERKNETD